MNFFTRLFSKHKVANNSTNPKPRGTNQEIAEIFSKPPQERKLSQEKRYTTAYGGNYSLHTSGRTHSLTKTGGSLILGTNQHKKEIVKVLTIPPKLQKIIEDEYTLYYKEFHKKNNIEEMSKCDEVYSKNHEHGFRFIKSEYEHINTMVHDIKNSNTNLKNSFFLDIGCGIPFVSNILKKVGCKKADGLEYNSTWIDEAKKYYPNIQVHQGDMLTFSEYSKYDILYAYNPSRNDEIMWKALGYIMQNMKIGSTLYFCNACLDDNVLINNGFDRVSLITSKTSKDLIQTQSIMGHIYKYTKTTQDVDITPLEQEGQKCKEKQERCEKVNSELKIGDIFDGKIDTVYKDCIEVIINGAIKETKIRGKHRIKENNYSNEDIGSDVKVKIRSLPEKEDEKILFDIVPDYSKFGRARSTY